MKKIKDAGSIRSFGRRPTFAEVVTYYEREDVVEFLYQECRLRNVHAAFRKRKWPIAPRNKQHLRKMIRELFSEQIEPLYRNEFPNPHAQRLYKYDYLSFHTKSITTKRNEQKGFDIHFEADLPGWRQSFDELCGVIRVLNEHEVFYRMKYSGARSLHIMIPFETLPKELDRRPITGLQGEIYYKLRRYLKRHGGKQKLRGAGELRLAYSFNEDNGLISIPIQPEHLNAFRPYEAHMYNIKIDQPWHGDVPQNAHLKTHDFIQMVFNDEINSAPQKRSIFKTDIGRLPTVNSALASPFHAPHLSPLFAQLESAEDSIRVEAAWRLLQSQEAIPLRILKKGLSDQNPDVRWYLTETISRLSKDDALLHAQQMLRDQDQFIRIGATDIFIYAGKPGLLALLECGKDFLNSEMVYAIQSVFHDISPETRLSKALAHLVVEFLKSALIGKKQLRSIVNLLRQLADGHSVSPETVQLVLPDLLPIIGSERCTPDFVAVLEALLKNSAVSQMVLDEVASVWDADFPPHRSTHYNVKEQSSIRHTIQGILEHFSADEKTQILFTLGFFGSAKTMKKALQVLSKVRGSLVFKTTTKLISRKDLSSQRLVKFSEFLPQNLLSSLNHNSIPGLIEQLKDKNPRLRIQAAKGLGDSGTPAATRALIEAFDDGHKAFYANVIRALGTIGKPAVAPLIKTLREHKKMKFRFKAALALGAVGDPSAIPVLIEALDYSNDTMRINVLRSLREIGKPAAKAVPFVIALFQDQESHHNVRSNAALALCATGTPEAIAAVKEGLKDTNDHVRIYSALALGDAGESAATKVLITTLTGSAWARKRAAKALKQIGTKTAIRALENFGPIS